MSNEDDEIEIISEESARKLMNESSVLKRQTRVVEIFAIIDNLNLHELENISLVEQTKKLPDDSTEKQIIEQSIENIPKIYGKFTPSNTAIGGLIGAGLGGIISYLIVGAISEKDKLAGAGIGAALGGALGSFIGSLWDSGV